MVTCLARGREGEQGTISHWQPLKHDSRGSIASITCPFLVLQLFLLSFLCVVADQSIKYTAGSFDYSRNNDN